MARSVEKVTKELTALEQSSKTLADEFYQTFLNYLKALGKVVKSKLILASYHLCTQAYPQAFLALSLTEKQKMQSGIRQVANVAVQELSILLPLSLRVEQKSQTQESQNPKNLSDATDEIIENLFDEMDESDEEYDADSVLEYDRNDPGDETNISIAPEEMFNQVASEVLTNPIKVYQWHQKIEKGILEILQTISRTTNSQLQNYNILPRHLPDILLEVAAKASSYGEPVGNMPNLLTLTIEVGNPEDIKKSKKSDEKEVNLKEAINIVTIHLRLSELEFSDPVVMAERNKIRQLSHRLNGLKREYEKKQEERKIALAEAAWRSSWCKE
jgi:hypothetical protein